jgi:hypothetical protein
MLDTRLVGVVSNKEISKNGKTYKAGTLLGYINSANVGIAKTILATQKVVQVINIFIDYNWGVVSEYGLVFIGDFDTKDLQVVQNFVITKIGARQIKPIEKFTTINILNKVNIYAQPTENSSATGYISATDITPSQRFFTNGYVYNDSKNRDWYFVQNASKTEKGWLLYDNKVVTFASTWSDFTKDITKVTIQAPLQAVRDTVESVQESSSQIKTFLGIALIVGLISIFKK